MKNARIEWRDGQPFSLDYDDIYFSKDDGLAESEHVFINQSLHAEVLLNRDPPVVFEIGFGTALNFILTVRYWLQHADADRVLYYIAVDNRPLSFSDMERVSKLWPELQSYYNEWLNACPLLVAGQHNLNLFNGRVQLQLIYRDALEALRDFEYKVDAWYLDGFAPSRNPDCWSQALLEQVARCSRQSARLSSYTSAGAVVRALTAVGFDVEKIPGYGRKRQIITARFAGDDNRTCVAPWYRLPVLPVSQKKAVVLGAGLAGLTVAWSLINRGWRVTIVDRCNEIASQASGNPAGLLLPRLAAGDATDAMFYSNAFLHTAKMLEQLQSFSDEMIWYSRGIYAVYDIEKTNALLQLYQGEPRFIRPVDCHDAGLVECSEHKALLYFEKAGCVSPQSICHAIVKLCGQDIDFIHADIKQLTRSENQWHCLTDDGCSAVSAPVLVLANGADVNSFDITHWLPVRSSRGQITALRASDKSRELKHAVSCDSYVTTEYHGMHYAGASYSYLNMSLQPDRQDDIENVDRLNECVPGVFDYADVAGARVALRAVSSDRVPVAGLLPDRDAFASQYADLHYGKKTESYAPGSYWPGLYVSAAHGSRGFTSTFQCAEIIAAMVNGHPMPVSNSVLHHLSPARFLIRQLRRGPISP